MIGIYDTNDKGMKGFLPGGRKGFSSGDERIYPRGMKRLLPGGWKDFSSRLIYYFNLCVISIEQKRFVKYRGQLIERGGSE